jgi:hypothetical protein
MTDDTPQTFKLTSPTGEVIMTGSMSAIMERLPDTHARDDALDNMLRTAIDAVEAEERRQGAVRSCAHMLDAFADSMNARIDAYEAKCEAEAKAAAEEAEREEQERIQSMLDQLPDPDDPEGIIPPAQDPTGTELENDDGDLTLKHEVDPERYGEREDEEPVKPALSYGNVPETFGNVPMSYIGKKDTEPASGNPLPFDPDAPGAVDVPSVGPEPGSRLYQHPRPGIPQPISISLNEE